MTKLRFLLVLAGTAALTLGVSGAATAAQAAPAATAQAASAALAQAAHAAGTEPYACSAAYFDGNSLLGPQDLPTLGPVGRQLPGYQRTGDQAPDAFLAKFRNGSGWIYPPDNGYVIIGGKPVEWVSSLHPGQDIDRYGSVYGSFLAPAGTPYADRSIPPASLESTPAASCNYHDYEILKRFDVDAGPIAGWFDQPGGGLQYQLDGRLIPGAPAQLNVQWLLQNGYLQEITPHV